jgi:hypothetical protein
MQSYQNSVVKLLLKKSVKILKKSAKLGKFGDKTQFTVHFSAEHLSFFNFFGLTGPPTQILSKNIEQNFFFEWPHDNAV